MTHENNLIKIFKTGYNNFMDYMIINKYTINSNDDIVTKFKIFILRYRRIIGIIILIILLYIGFYCDKQFNRNLFQNGGAGLIKAVQGASKHAGKLKGSINSNQLAGMAAQHELPKFNGAGNFNNQSGAYAGNKFKEFAGWLYQIMFAIAMSIAICMVVLPSISFVIIGIFCFILLKSKISNIKAL